jgi:hypothetical protein
MGYVVCVSDDLHKDAELYAGGHALTKVNDFSKAASGDLLVLYAHGQYNADGSAANTIIWGKEALTPVQTAERLTDNLHLNVGGIKLLVHACFTAGSIEKPPPKASAFNTFAGQLCSALKGKIRGLTVIGLVGETKAGRAGFNIGAGAETQRITRATKDLHARELWEVQYQLNENGDVVIVRVGEQAMKVLQWQ